MRVQPSAGNTTLRRVRLIDCSGSGNGVAVDSYGALEILDSTVAGSSTTGNSAIYQRYGSLAFSRLEVVDNVVRGPAWGLYGDDTTISGSDSSFLYNRPNTSPLSFSLGAVGIKDSQLTLTGTQLSHNIGYVESAALGAEFQSTATLNGCRIEHNQKTALSISSSKLKINGSVIRYNTGTAASVLSTSGGAYPTEAYFTDSLIAYNEAESSVTCRGAVFIGKGGIKSTHSDWTDNVPHTVCLAAWIGSWDDGADASFTCIDSFGCQ